MGAVLAVLGVGGAVMAAGAVLWGGGDALDATVAWAEGGITGRQLLVSASLSIGLAVVGGGAAKVGAKTLQELDPRVHGLVNLARTGSAVGAGGRLPQDMGLVKQIAAKAGVGLDGVKGGRRLGGLDAGPRGAGPGHTGAGASAVPQLRTAGVASPVRR